MSRSTLIPTIVIAMVLPSAGFMATDPHMDPTLIPQGCAACHLGHGRSDSPMLPAPQVDVCLSCHGSQGRQAKSVTRRRLSPAAGPRSLSAVLSQGFVHPISDEAYSRHQEGVVTCTSCHSPHRRNAEPEARTSRTESEKRSRRGPIQTEFELCAKCHGGTGPSTRNPLEVTVLASARSKSYHPLQTRAIDPSPSILPSLSGREIVCSDCHGNDDETGARGPHGSSIRYILRDAYVTIDGTSESAETYALCYACHDREKVLESRLFPEHRRHVEDFQTSCATCHNPHGSLENRALIRFGEDVGTATVAPSALAGELRFESRSPGNGACYLTCHGFDHAPEFYGASVKSSTLEEKDSRGRSRYRSLRSGGKSSRRSGERTRK